MRRVTTRAPRTFHCALDPSCPEVSFEGDPHAVSPFRGYGDPSLERDPATGDLWLSHSWLEARLEMGETEPDLTVVTHLASSEDDGRTFAVVRTVNSTAVVDGPAGGRGFWLHEVSSLSRSASEWRLVWLDYFDAVGAGERAFFHFALTTAAEPALLGETAERWVGVAAGVAPLTVTHDVPSIAGLEDCTTLTEPALFHHDGGDWLVASCVVVDASGRHPERERLVLLRETADRLELVGTLFDASDAASARAASSRSNSPSRAMAR
jgi:hypothetical protein